MGQRSAITSRKLPWSAALLHCSKLELDGMSPRMHAELAFSRGAHDSCSMAVGTHTASPLYKLCHDELNGLLCK